MNAPPDRQAGAERRVQPDKTAGDKHPPVAQQKRRNMACSRRRAEAHLQIEPVLNQVQRRIREHQLHLRLRELFAEFRDHRRDISAAELKGGIDPQKTLRLATCRNNRLFRCRDAIDDLVRGGEIGLPLAGQAEPARGAADQSNAQPFLDPCKPPAYRRCSQSKFQGGLRQAVSLRDHCKKAHIALAAHVLSIHSFNAIMK